MNTTTIRIGKLTYTVEPTASTMSPYVLRGPRGGRIDTVRNIKSGVLFLMQGARTLPVRLTDHTGTVEVAS